MRPFLFASMLAVAHAWVSPDVPAPLGRTRDLATTGSPGKLLDRFGESGLDFDQWVDQMVEEGHLYRPNVTDDGLILGRSTNWSIKLKSVACATIAGNRDLMAKTQEHFCNFVQTAEQIYAQQMETDVKNNLCDHLVCRLSLRALFDFFNVFKDVDDGKQFCHELFNAMNNACPDGGVADTELDNGAEVQSGQLQSSYDLENGQPCDQDATHECFNGSPP
ncbi:hypothetical protein UCREL1_11283 [Eutypa lata UCREL1]|uniref:Uncharacterized protein n=1 Tax=Eutypa lata (strain UCR-EL1) TaxID=1287681 RepID=M7T574_EUTLA|nr:hypothetical protein UCREL1_11283 [Eutypa lata UCREL1]